MQQIEMWEIGKLHPYEHNPRDNDKAVPKMIRSIEEYGFKIPILARTNGEIVDGHLRYKAAISMGLVSVPVLLMDDLSEAQVRGFRLLANRSVNWAEWDEEKLARELSELEVLGFNLAGAGFESNEIERLLKLSEGECAEEKARRPEIVKSSNMEALAPTEEERLSLEGRRLLVEFSGGKDSSAAALWCRHFFPDNELILLYVDMGADFTSYSLYLNEFSNALGVNLETLRSQRNIFDVLLEKGKWPHFMHPYCHDILHQALDDYMLQCAPADNVVIRGGRASEKGAHVSARETRYLTVERMSAYVYFQPLYFLHKDVGVSLLSDAGLPIWEGYSYGLQRTACRICPGQKPAAYAAIRAQFPEVWEELLRLERFLGVGYWQDSTTPKVATLEDLANRGQKNYLAEGYAPRFRRG